MGWGSGIGFGDWKFDIVIGDLGLGLEFGLEIGIWIGIWIGDWGLVLGIGNSD